MKLKNKLLFTLTLIFMFPFYALTQETENTPLDDQELNKRKSNRHYCTGKQTFKEWKKTTLIQNIQNFKINDKLEIPTVFRGKPVVFNLQGTFIQAFVNETGKFTNFKYLKNGVFDLRNYIYLYLADPVTKMLLKGKGYFNPMTLLDENKIRLSQRKNNQVVLQLYSPEKTAKIIGNKNLAKNLGVYLLDNENNIVDYYNKHAGYYWMKDVLPEVIKKGRD